MLEAAPETETEGLKGELGAQRGRARLGFLLTLGGRMERKCPRHGAGSQLSNLDLLPPTLWPLLRATGGIHG